ncbi:MAG: riboflavin kinase [Anaerolineae bacterium]
MREALLAGEVDQARDWLGRSYSLTGEVVHGDHRGRLLGFLTANMAVWDEQVIPANGIYAGWAHRGTSVSWRRPTSVSVRSSTATT